MKKLLIIDDHKLIYDGIKAVLKDDYTINYAASLEAAQNFLIQDEFDVVIIDITLGNDVGFDIVDDLKPQQEFYFLSMHKSSYFIDKAIKYGANGYFIKDEPIHIILDCLKRADKSEFFMSSDVKAELENLRHNNTLNLYDSLSPREQQVFSMLVNDESVNEIGYKLEISGKTVKNHRSTIMKKLEVDSLSELIEVGSRLGIL